MFHPVTYAELDTLQTKLADAAKWVNKARFRQMTMLRRLDRLDVYRTDGARSMGEWVASRLDVTPEVASDLLCVTRGITRYPDLETRFRNGDVTLGRVAATLRLAAAAHAINHPELVDSADGYDLAGLRRLTAACRRMTRRDEHEAHTRRFFSMQPTLDHSGERISGFLPGTAADIVHRALVDKADTFPRSHVTPTSSGQHLADALVAMSHDSLDGAGSDTARSTPSVTVFVDAHRAAATGGELGATVAAGARVGPATLAQILCEGAVGVVTVQDNTPVSVTAKTRAIPPAIRDFVLDRDGGCTIDGCTSRYRLQPHHVRHHADGGDHDPANLATLCWYHHHIEIHRYGRMLDPASPPQRRRFIPGRWRDPHHSPPY